MTYAFYALLLGYVHTNRFRLALRSQGNREQWSNSVVIPETLRKR
jgi:hypothetical protein